MNLKKFLLIGLLCFTAQQSNAQTTELSNDSAVTYSETRADANLRPEISATLEAERRVSTVKDAIAIKETALVYVRDLADFEYLSSFTVSNPSDAYKNAVGDFIATYVARFTFQVWDLYYLNILEQRTVSVSQAISVKTAGLNVVTDIGQFLQILPFSVPTPSDTYRTQVSTFVANNIHRVLNYNSPIDQILQAEVYTKTVSDAMTVKNAGLIAVHSKYDLLRLAEYSVPTPSPTYRSAVETFIRDNIGRYP